ncbi:MAG TPA: hypothetical protein VK050_00205 [Flavobacteriaceae bacterium]|nr:hypothetical protein [Flavobacteriaceae bacterium]
MNKLVTVLKNGDLVNKNSNTNFPTIFHWLHGFFNGDYSSVSYPSIKGDRPYQKQTLMELPMPLL